MKSVGIPSARLVIRTMLNDVLKQPMRKIMMTIITENEVAFVNAYVRNNSKIYLIAMMLT